VGNKTRTHHKPGAEAPKRGIAVADDLVEVAIENAGSGLKQQVGTARRLAHRLTFATMLVDDLVDHRLYKAGGDAFAGAEALAIVHDVAHVHPAKLPGLSSGRGLRSLSTMPPRSPCTESEPDPIWHR
jgi:hypothetical protein